MRLGVISDSHGYLDLVNEVLGELGPLDFIIHAGDYYQDGAKLGEMYRVDFVSVVGNCDRGLKGPVERQIDFAGKKILVTHGHVHGVKSSCQKLLRYGRKLGIDILVFGHTHKPFFHQEDEIILFNPGSPYQPRGNSKPSIGLLEVNGNEVKARILEINRQTRVVGVKFW